MIERTRGELHMEEGAGRGAEVKERLAVMREQLDDRMQELDRRTRNFVREHPLAAIGCAAAAGYLLARLVAAVRD